MSQTENWMSKVSVRGLCVDLLRNLWMIVLAAITMWCASAGLHNLTYQPTYTSSATLVIGVKGDSSIYSSLSLASQMAEVFGQVFKVMPFVRELPLMWELMCRVKSAALW